VHDLIPLIDPAQFRGLSRWYWTAYLPQGWRRCAALTVSNESLVADVAQRLDFPAARIYVVPYYCSLSAGDVAAALATPRPVSAPYFMTLASHEPRKNLVLVLNALALLAERGLRPAVVCVGSRTAHSLPLRQLAQRLGVGSQVTWPDYVPRSLVLQLLRHAVALLFVSRYEGYGMPPQEAQVLGTPVVLSDIASHRSVYGDAHRWAEVEPELQSPPPFVGIDDVTALADKMERLMRDPSWGLQLAAAGRAYQRSFSPQETGKALRAAFQQALGV
jgi:glycosyltransferase involved in cell wall biosynthesis